MDKKDITPADVSRSLNRLEGFIDDLLPNIQSLCERNIEDVWTQLSYWVTDVHNNREGDNKNYIGVCDCVDFILNNKSIDLAKRAFSIEAKVKEIESIVLPYISNQITQKVASEFLWETGRILWQIGELHIEPFIQETSQTGDIPETGENKDANDEGDEHENNYPDFNYELKRLFKTEEIFKSFYDKSKDLSPEDIASLYSDQSNVLNPQKRGVAKTLYDTFVNPNQDADKIVYETFVRYLRKSDTE